MLLPYLTKDKSIFITGHSLGGGRAHQFAALLIRLGYKVTVVVFGSPRPGDSALRRSNRG